MILRTSEHQDQWSPLISSLVCLCIWSQGDVTCLCIRIVSPPCVSPMLCWFWILLSCVLYLHRSSSPHRIHWRFWMFLLFSESESMWLSSLFDFIICFCWLSYILNWRPPNAKQRQDHQFLFSLFRCWRTNTVCNQVYLELVAFFGFCPILMMKELSEITLLCRVLSF